MTNEELIEQTRQPLVFCIIPARKNSRRLKNKNKLLLNGKPLILYTMEVAQESGVFNRIVVSSDDEEILVMAYEMGLMIHKRPAALAKSHVELKSVCRFVFKAIDALPGEFAVLSPTNPFRTAEDIRNCHNLLRNSDANYVISVRKACKPPQWALKRTGKYIKPYWGIEYFKNAQELEKLYYPDGSIIFVKTPNFLSNFDKAFYGDRAIPYIMNRSIDIDTEEDFIEARRLMNAIRK